MSEPIVNNRPQFGANPTADASLPWARQGGATEQRATPRARRMVQGLPEWEPLPPGELLIRRPTSS